MLNNACIITLHVIFIAGLKCWIEIDSDYRLTNCRMITQELTGISEKDENRSKSTKVTTQNKWVSHTKINTSTRCIE